MPVVIYNPCLDPNFFYIMPVSMPAVECPLFSEDCHWSHDPFGVWGTTEMIEMCGGVTYFIDAGEFNVYITYTVSVH